MLRVIPQNLEPPKFVKTLSNLEIMANTPLTFKLPAIIDIDDDAWTVMPMLGGAA